LAVTDWNQGHDESETKYEAKFTFAKTPFRFFFPPNAFTSERLSFAYKRSGASGWTAATVPQTAEVRKGYCDEVTIEVPESTSEDGQATWEARWSAL